MAPSPFETPVDFAAFRPNHFLWSLDGKAATITLDRPERKNPLTFESCAELRDTFRALARADDVKAVVLAGAGGNMQTQDYGRAWRAFREAAAGVRGELRRDVRAPSRPERGARALGRRVAEAQAGR